MEKTHQHCSSSQRQEPASNFRIDPLIRKALKKIKSGPVFDFLISIYAAYLQGN